MSRKPGHLTEARSMSRNGTKLPGHSRGTEMQERYSMKIARDLSAWIGIAVLSVTMVCASEVRVKDQPSVAATGQAATEATTSTENGARRPVLQQRNPRYQMCRGDIFELSFPFTPEFNQTITIQPDGYVTLTGVGDLYVVGKTVPELRESLQTVYAKI